MKLPCSAFVRLLLIPLFASAFGGNMVRAEETNSSNALKPLNLIDFAAPDAGKYIEAAKGIPAGSSVTLDKTGIVLNFTPFQKGDGFHPGVHVFPASVPATGKFWDLSPYGHIEAKIINTGTTSLMAVMHISDEGEGYWTENKVEFVSVKPGETKLLKVIFGYQKGFKPGPPVKTDKIKEVFIFLYDSPLPHSFRIEELKAAGVAGEKPDAEPATKP